MLKTSDDYAQELAKTWAFADETVDDVESTIREAVNEAFDAAAQVALDKAKLYGGHLAMESIAASITSLKDVRS